jgi:hypothetical protein
MRFSFNYLRGLMKHFHNFTFKAKNKTFRKFGTTEIFFRRGFQKEIEQVKLILFKRNIFPQFSRFIHCVKRSWK